MSKEKAPGAMTLAEKASFGMGPIGKNMCSSLVYGSFLSLYFMKTLGISPAYLSIMFLLCRIWDGVNDLFMGAIIDATHSKYGKFRPWIFFGALTNAICTILIYWDPGFRGVPLYIYVTVLYLLCDLTFTMIDVAYWALIPALTLDRKERDQVSVIPRLTGAIGGAVSSFTLNIVDALGGEGSNAGFLKYALITSVVYLATSTICAANSKERVHSVTVSQEKFSLVKAAKILFSNDQALNVVVIMLLFNAASCVTGAVMMYYFIYVINSRDFYGTFGILTGVIQGIGLLGFPLLSKKIDRNKVYIFAYLMPIVGYVLMALVGSADNFNMILFIVVSSLIYISYGAMGVMENVMLADAVDYGEWKTGQRNEGIIFSMLTFLSKIANGISSGLTFAVFAIVGFNADAEVAPTSQAVLSFKILLFAVPVVFLIGAAIVHKVGFKLKPELVEQISRELGERHAAANAQTAAEEQTAE